MMGLTVDKITDAKNQAIKAQADSKQIYELPDGWEYKTQHFTNRDSGFDEFGVMVYSKSLGKRQAILYSSPYGDVKEKDAIAWCLPVLIGWIEKVS